MKKRSLVLLMALCLLVVTALTGCNSSDKSDKQSQQPQLTTMEVVLYFSDDQANFLVPEKRNISIEEGANDEVLAASIMKELIAGPENKELIATIPAEAKILSVKIDEGIASADFSKELQSKHWGGSTGEGMTLNSIANTLTELDSIDKVQLLIEGKKVESLAGHWDTTAPLERNEEIIRK
ncbi:MAG TPA: GerMN domain-containing protein [Gelria sp.]|jgi:germination protein M|nr:GerMN domain-containing protein [Gelria sp.]